MPVPQYHRSPRADVIDVGVSVGVEDPAALGTVDKERVGADRFAGANRTVDATRNAGQRLLIETFRPLKIHIFHPFRLARHRLRSAVFNRLRFHRKKGLPIESGLKPPLKAVDILTV
jgi:hypothetical protein